MSKIKWGLTIIACLGLTLGSLWAFVLTKATNPIDKTNYQCPFCDPKKIANQAYYEGKYLLVYVNYAPVLDGHSMIITKRHVERIEDLTPEEFAEIPEVIKRVQRAFQSVYQTSDVLLCCQNGALAGQTVPHMHFHIIPRQEKNVYTKLKLWYAMLVRPLDIISPMNDEQLHALSVKLGQAMQD